MSERTGSRPEGASGWVGLGIATVAFVLPLLAFGVAIVAVEGDADVAYFEAVAQIIPIVVLALALELRYFSPGREVRRRCGPTSGGPSWRGRSESPTPPPPC